MSRDIVERSDFIIMLNDLPHSIVNNRDGLKAKAYDWCLENDIQYRKVLSEIRDYEKEIADVFVNLPGGSRLVSYALEFQSEEDAMAFKMRWM